MQRHGDAAVRIGLITIAWVIALAVGFISMTQYEFTPGEAAMPPETWPVAATKMVSHKSGQPTLVVFAHPKCPCTRATMTEFERLMAANLGRVNAHVLFFKPADVPETWAQTDLWDHAKVVPGTRIFTDEAGKLAELFQAKTSGTALLYDSKGTLVFRGGLTSSRGHEGDNLGSATITALLNSQRTQHHTSPVFGCALQNAPN